MPLVSVVIPAHNAALYLEECIASALAQTWPWVEVIVVNDGSTDGTAAVLQSFGSQIRVVDQNQRGVAIARNRGAALANGEWLAFLDADDVWLSNKLDRQLAVCTDDTQFVYSDRLNIGALAGLPEIHGDLQYMYDGHVFADLLSGNVITTSTVMMRRSLFERLGGFSEEPDLPPAEDWDLWLRVAAEHAIVACREPLVKYRLHDAGASRNPERMNRARIKVVERALQLPAARALAPSISRRVWALTFATNGWDAGRHGKRAQALEHYARAIARWPCHADFYRQFVKVCVRRL